jgi:hypothetical protein
MIADMKLRSSPDVKKLLMFLGCCPGGRDDVLAICYTRTRAVASVAWIFPGPNHETKHKIDITLCKTSSSCLIMRRRTWQLDHRFPGPFASFRNRNRSRPQLIVGEHGHTTAIIDCDSVTIGNLRLLPVQSQILHTDRLAKPAKCPARFIGDYCFNRDNCVLLGRSACLILRAQAKSFGNVPSTNFGVGRCCKVVTRFRVFRRRRSFFFEDFA